jgi:phosphotriesterase-related protein
MEKCPLVSLFFFFLVILSCKEEKGVIMTVNGPVAATKAGTILPHEHILVDFIGADSTGYFRWNRDTVISHVLPYLIEAKSAGVNALMECTPAYLGRDPVLLQMLSDSCGIHIITNTGFYGAMQNKSLPEAAYTMTTDQLAELWTSEWLNGIESTKIKPGFIKIAVAPDSVLTPVHEKLVRAAARAHLKTGLTINGHTGPDATVLAEMAILHDEGVDPSAFIWTHAQRGSFEVHVNMAQKGCWIALDNVMIENIDKYVSMLINLKKHNLLNKVLLSHDAGWYNVTDPQSVAYRSHTAIFTHLKPALMSKGFTEDEWQQMTMTNPAEAYTIRIRHLRQ